MFHLVFDLVKMTRDLGRTALQLAVLPLRIVFGRSLRRARKAALLVGLGAAAGAVAATSTKRA